MRTRVSSFGLRKGLIAPNSTFGIGTSVAQPMAMASGMFHRALALTALLVGCQTTDEVAPAVELDPHAFRCEVEPVLAARCSQPTCHGSGRRPFRVFAVNRLRLNPVRAQTGYVLNQPMTAEEHQANYEMTMGFVDAGDHEQSLLLMKPLDSDAGGYYHQGKTLYGNQDVFTTEDDPGYRAIEAWLEGGTRPEDCEAREEVGS